MSAVGGVQAPGWWGSLGSGLRLLVGWFSIAIAVLNLTAELGQPPERAYLLFHGLLLVGGLLLVSFGWGAGTGPAGLASFGLVLTAGMLCGALPVNDAGCCLNEFSARHGYPFTFLARGAGGRWHLDGPHLAADLLFWGYAGLIAVALLTAARRITQHHGGGGG